VQFTLRGLKDKTEYEKLYAFYPKVFVKTPLSFFIARIENDSYMLPEDIRIAEEDGNIISSVAVLKRKMNWGNSIVSFAGIGNVSTLPEKRGNNLATLLMKDAISYSKAINPHSIILFTGINPFYEKLGFFTIPAYHIVFNINNACNDNYLIRDFNFHDMPSIGKLYNSFNEKLFGTLARDDNYWKANLTFAEPGEIFLVAEKDNAVEAYIRMVNDGFRNEIWEFAFVRREALDALLSAASKLLNKNNIKTASLHPYAMLDNSPCINIDFEPTSLAMAYTDINGAVPGLKQSFNNYSFWWTDNF
jgi:predicted acetyltransferase